MGSYCNQVLVGISPLCLTASVFRPLDRSVQSGLELDAQLEEEKKSQVTQNLDDLTLTSD